VAAINRWTEVARDHGDKEGRAPALLLDDAYGLGSLANLYTLRGVDLRNMENLAGPAHVQNLRRAATESADFLAAYRAATADPRAMLSRDSNKDYGPSLRVVRRFCGILLFFACWAAVRHWPQPVPYLSNMLKVAFAVCLAFALFQRERFADANLNYWDESLGYIATAVLLDYLEG
jgi:hypothetical protein